MTNETLTHWEPSAVTRGFAAGIAAAGVDVDAELLKFRAYAHRQVIHDPDRAYKAWLKKALDFQAVRREKKAAVGEDQSKPTDTERMLAQIHAFQESSPAEYRRLELYMEQHRWWEKSDRGFQVAQMLSAIHDREIIFAYLESQGREF